jgi:short subunit dehydrogenase-like uncharacterized protein
MDFDKLAEDLHHQGMSDEEIDDFFAHYGVPGMKWGVRKAKNQLAVRDERRNKLSNKTKKVIDYNSNRYTRRARTVGWGLEGGAAAATVASLVAGSAAVPVVGPVFAAGAVGGAVISRRIMLASGQNRYIKIKNDMANKNKRDSSAKNYGK